MGMMGLRGVSIIQASGDGGRHPSRTVQETDELTTAVGVGASCRANDGSNKVEFTPQFPASCPYITTVGGTQGYDPEAAWVGSGGGFSNYFRRPWYQDRATRGYLDRAMNQKLRKEYAQYTNYRGRGIPDIAAHSASP